MSDLTELCFLVKTSGVNPYTYSVEQQERWNYLCELYQHRHERVDECRQFVEYVLRNIEIEGVTELFISSRYTDAVELMYLKVKNHLEKDNII